MPQNSLKKKAADKKKQATNVVLYSRPNLSIQSFPHGKFIAKE